MTGQAKIHIHTSMWIFALFFGIHRGCTVDQLSRLLWWRPRRTYTWTSQPKLVSLVGWLVGTVNGEQPIHRHFLDCRSTMYAINFSTVESSVLVKGEDLSGDSDTSLLDFAESGE